MHPRQIAYSVIRGLFPIPIGLRLLQREPADYPTAVTVSTVCLNDGHKEDPLGILDPETGYETMVFFEGCSLFSIYQKHYETRAEAKRGHKAVVRKLLARKLPLAVQLTGYVAHEEMEPRRAA